MKLTNRRIKTVIIFFICVVILSACKGEQSALNDDVILTETEENDVVIKGDMNSFVRNVTGRNEEIGGIPGNMINEGRICESEGIIYYSNGNCLYKKNKTVNEEEKRLLVEENDMCREICVMGDYVYYITSARIKRVDKNGGEARVLTEIPALYMQLTENKIYFACNGVYSMNLDGSELELLTKVGLDDEVTSDLIWLNLYKDYVLYVSTDEPMTLYAVNKDAAEVYCLKEHVYFPVVEGDYIYYQDEEDKIVNLSLVTGEIRSITDSFYLRPILMDTKLYFTDYFGIYCFDTDTEEMSCIYPNYDIEDGEKTEDNIDLFWITEESIFFTGAVAEEGNMGGITCMDYTAEMIDILK